MSGGMNVSLLPPEEFLMRWRVFRKDLEHTETEDGEVFHRKEFRWERCDQVTHEIELEDVSFFSRILDRLRSFKRTRVGGLDSRFSIDTRQRPSREEILLGGLGRVEEPRQISNGWRNGLEFMIAAQKG